MTDDARALALVRRHTFIAVKLLYQRAHANDPDCGAGERAWLLDRHAQLVEALTELYPPEVAQRALGDAQARLELVPPLSAAGAADLLMAWGESLETECRS
jgi:hypothetical protein